MHNQKTAVVIASVAGIISWFLPFIGTAFSQQSLMDAGSTEGYIILIAFIISLIVAFSGDKSLPMEKGQLAGAMIPGIVPALFLVIMLIRVKSDDFAHMAVNFEYGFYLMLIASIAILVLGLGLKDYDSPSTARATYSTEKSFCTNCGKQLPANQGQFCEECGNKL